MTVLDYLIEPLRCYSISAVYLEYLLCLSKAAYAAEKECQRAVAVVAVANCRSVGTSIRSYLPQLISFMNSFSSPTSFGSFVFYW